MKIIVCSDSHGDLGVLIEMMEANPTAQLLLFLGDGVEELGQLKKLYPHRPMHAVCGNCDRDRTPLELIVPVGSLRLLLTHGHHFGVKQSLSSLFSQGKQRAVDGVLYGHTHRAEITWRDGVLYFCPGSVSKASGSPSSYGILTVGGTDIIPEIMWLKKGKLC